MKLYSCIISSASYRAVRYTRRPHNVIWYDDGVVELPRHDVRGRGIRTGDWVGVTSRVGATMRAVVTTESSNWATNCPQYHVTAERVLVTQPAGSRKHCAKPDPVHAMTLNGHGVPA
jgi:formate dehydrogenase major subunit